MSAHTMVQTSFLTLIRVCLYLSCRRYLLRSLVQNLRRLSGPSFSLTLRAPNVPHELHSDFYIDQPESTSSLPQPVGVSPRFPEVRGGASPLWHLQWSRTAFSLCFSESCILFLLVVFQSMDLFSESARLLNWELSLSLLVALIMLIIPLSQCLLIVYPSSKHSIVPFRTLVPRHLIISLSLYLAYLYALSFIPIPEAQTTNGPSISFLYSIALGRLVVLGVFTLGVLSGFGAARNACILGILLYRSGCCCRTGGMTGLQDISSEEGGLARIESELGDKRRALMKEEATQQPRGTWMSRLLGNNATSDLRQEISALESLRDQMSGRLKRVKARRAQELYDRSLPGKLWNVVSLALGVYCVYKILAATLVISMPSLRSSSFQSGLSPMDATLQWMLTSFPSLASSVPPEQAISLSRQLSLLMVGIIVLGSIRAVFKGVNKMLRVTSKNLAASLMLLVLAQILGTYLLSTLIQLRTSFPLSPDATNRSLFATLPDFNVFGPLFDASFLISAFVSILGIWAEGLKGRMNDSGILSHDMSDRSDWELVNVGKISPG